MKAIVVEFKPATETRPAKWRVTAESKALTFSCEECSTPMVAAIALATQSSWPGTWYGGQLPDGRHVYVCAQAGGVGSFTVEPPQAEVPAPTPLWRVQADYARAQIAIGERAILAVYDDGEPPLTLSLGDALGVSTRAGAVMARLFATPRRAPFIVGIRPGGPPLPRERDAAERIMAASRLVDLPVAGVVLVTSKEAYLLAEAPAPTETAE